MRDLSVYLRDILSACESISAFTAGMDLDAFRKDEKTGCLPHLTRQIRHILERS